MLNNFFDNCVCNFNFRRLSRGVYFIIDYKYRDDIKERLKKSSKQLCFNLIGSYGKRSKDDFFDVSGDFWFVQTDVRDLAKVFRLIISMTFFPPEAIFIEDSIYDFSASISLARNIFFTSDFRMVY